MRKLLLRDSQWAKSCHSGFYETQTTCEERERNPYLAEEIHLGARYGIVHWIYQEVAFSAAQSIP